MYGPRHGTGGRAEAVVAAAELEIFGEDHEPGAAARCLRGECRRPVDVGVDITGRVELDESYREAHDRMLRGPVARVIGRLGRSPTAQVSA